MYKNTIKLSYNVGAWESDLLVTNVVDFAFETVLKSRHFSQCARLASLLAELHCAHYFEFLRDFRV